MIAQCGINQILMICAQMMHMGWIQEQVSGQSQSRSGERPRSRLNTDVDRRVPSDVPSRFTLVGKHKAARYV